MRKSKSAFKFKIDKNIPIPQPEGWCIYELSRLKPSESFEFNKDRLGSVRAVVHKRQGKKLKEKYIIRRWKANTNRCWRVK